MEELLVPKSIQFETKSLSGLSNLKGNKAIIVTDQGVMEELGFLDQAISYLKNSNLETKVIDGVEPNPSVKTVMKGKEKMLDFNPDWIIGLGGGSTLDAAKMMWAFYEHPELNFEEVIEVNSLPKLRNKAKFAAVPSTSGTGSEMTAFAVITDAKEKIKYPIVSPELIPDIAIIDPKLPATMPKQITANTGMDVLTHAIEAFVSTNATDYTDPLALKAIKLVFKYLRTAYKKGDDIKARTKMHNASAIAGIAFSNASLGIVHSLAHKIGGELDITHGLANAILLPYVIDFNYETAEEKYKTIKHITGEQNLSEAIKELNEDLNIPSCFKKLDDINENEFKKILDRMSENALQDACTLTNPKEPNVTDMKEIYKQAFYGK
ncbi:iron-containing alcohol dehydrogenase [Sporohalobacter salinus]|uniref:iron-containing alcohol dehydrogenase n=1 Tax=Sporohalobacter salinus TaxID=1494606 RepID=UPI00195F2C8E|nr:iron-containing alcohol dehydrogenase [Sporohalobacter salinus]MBM7624472.1 alcohol dehydrogenase class IV [Sporohalobacter salinus]